MKFITEMDLRLLYQNAPFQEYKVQENMRLTPGGRQFLLDRNIKIEQPLPALSEKKQLVPSKKSDTLALKQVELDRKMKQISALYLVIVQQLLDCNVCLSQQIIQLFQQFKKIQKAKELYSAVECLPCEECTGIHSNNYHESLGCCFEITEFHIQLEQGKEITLLHYLRTSLEELESYYLEAFDVGSEHFNWCLEMIARINEIINTLNHMICHCVGGSECQRK